MLTNADEVKAIIKDCTLTAEQIEPFITVADIYLTKVFADDTTLTTIQMGEIQRWFTAHLIVFTGYQSTQVIKREKIGDAEVEYSVTAKAGAGLTSTPYGQMALQFDTSGLLAKAGRMQASIYAVKSFSDDEI